MKQGFNLIKWAGCAMVIIFSGCKNENDPVMLGKDYGMVYVEGNTVLHDGGNLRLYQYLPNGTRKLLCSQLIVGEREVAGDMIVFNGVADGEMRSMFYPALFGYTGSGFVVELSRTLARRITHADQGVAYSFFLQPRTNEIFVVNATQLPPINTNYPWHLPVSFTEQEIRDAVETGKTNGRPAKYGGVEFMFAE